MRNSIYTASDDDSSLKMIGDAYDKAQSTWLQYLAFLEQTHESEALSSKLPSLTDMVLKHRFSPAEALTSLRSVLAVRYTDVQAIAQGAEAEEAGSVVPEGGASIVEDIVRLFPGGFPQGLSPQLYVAFWSLRLYDVSHPKVAYEEVQRKLAKRVTEVVDGQGQFEEWPPAKREKEVEKIRAQIAKLDEDAPVQEAHVRAVRAHFRAQAGQWLRDVPDAWRQSIILDLLQHCLFPRCKMSAEDAIYCAEFVQLLHDTNTLNFSTVHLYELIVKFITPMIGCTTENEAAHYGRFLGLLLGRVNRWRNEDEYARTAVNTLGFRKTFDYADKVAFSFLEFVDIVFRVSSSWLVALFVLCWSSHTRACSGIVALVATRCAAWSPRSTWCIATVC